jgi:hypothetical protein
MESVLKDLAYLLMLAGFVGLVLLAVMTPKQLDKYRELRPSCFETYKQGSRCR